ncbi:MULTISPECIES: HNH endonuclease signature motif containing protein [Streptomyces]|uniref:HNH nuclease domain-containing protein n=1 Tax=Streptomyces rimosus subsp. rimosus TaxID=132474 RepID=A0ABY3Z4B4_STRRM|nr:MULTISPECIES: HNH endonuclease signature motif containing protein [Streptomyces]KOG70556.1 hypothetical protein ADK78_28645 [Kitasatospora aureofaciens]KEF04670.1 hypothetical protein DF17_22545 [Streptomyces rimosus]UNZ05096.1 hypothetical protein SRIMR7_23350 [Streptomyces rimosus subsp. rimosus]UTH96550.1 hypothetical protein SRIMHP_20715 [Streptomyces rimosus subsp. rimosus]UTJ14647.1 hypothetical protein SRIMDV3_20610 [Streptomyces rimosus subsp. rimosus]
MKTTEERFWEKVDGANVAGCWIWRGAGNGYGRFYASGRNVLAHRWAYEYLRASIPESLVLDHLCRNAQCVNPWHLEPVSQAENLRRGNGFSGRNARKTHCPRGHPLTGMNSYLAPSGGRACRTCRRSAYRAHRAANRERINTRKRAAYAAQKLADSQKSA